MTSLKGLRDEIWQPIMDSAFDKLRETEFFQTRDPITESELLGELEKVERDAYLLGTFNYQVENGGFSQWVNNGYAVHIDDLIDLLKDIGRRHSLQIARWLAQLAEELDYDGQFINEGHSEEQVEYEEVYVGNDEDGEPIYEE